MKSLRILNKDREPTDFTRFVLYPLIFFFFLSVFTFLIIAASGFRISYADNKLSFQRTGMIILASHPFGADIFLNGKSEGKKTGYFFFPTKMSSILPGDYTISLKKDGYKTWEDVVSVVPNLVTRINYALLFKENLDLKELSFPSDVKIIPNAEKNNLNNDMILSKTENGLTTLYIYDANKDTSKKIWPPEEQLTESLTNNSEITGVKLNKGNDRVIIYLKNGETTSYGLIDFSTEVSTLIFLESKFEKAFSKLVWSTTDPSQLLALSDAGLYIINLKDNSISDLIASSVVDFSVEKNKQIYYIVDKSASFSLFQMNLDGNNKKLISEKIAKSKTYKISYSSKANALAILPYDDKGLYIYNGISEQMSPTKLSEDSLDFEWSNDSEKIYYSDGKIIKNYNFEKQKSSQVDMGENILSIDWYYDNFHYLVQTENGLFVIDYDGSNKVCIHSGQIDQESSYLNGDIIFSYVDGTALEFKRFVSGF
jgi:hypothetical protein